MNKIQQFIGRNRKRNSHLYDDNLINGIDYIVCPVTQARLSMIKTSYITKVLGMTVDEYDQLYPGVRGVSPARKENIKQGVQRIDPTTGLTNYEHGQIKARETLKQVDNSGMSGYAKKGKATRATHMANIDEHGRNGYSQIATKAIIKGNATKAEKGLILPPESRNEFYRYKAIVSAATNQHRSKISKGYNTGLAGTPGGYRLDHKFSIMQGYTNQVSPLVIGHELNLEMIEWEDNLRKHTKSSISLDELFALTEYTIAQSQHEFNTFINYIQEDIQLNNPTTGWALIRQYHDTTLHRKL